MESISDKGNRVGREAPSAAVGPCWAGQADQALGPVASATVARCAPAR
jgi:hypothetical protein